MIVGKKEMVAIVQADLNKTPNFNKGEQLIPDIGILKS